MRTALLTLLALSAYAVAEVNHWPTSTDCDDDDIPTPTKSTTLPYPTWGGGWTTSTIYRTTTHTITSCGPEVVSCPAHSTVATTVIIPVSTTVCPVTATATARPAPPSSIVSPVAPPPAPSSWKAPPAPPASTWVAPSLPVTPVAPPPAAPTTLLPTSVGTVAPPSRTAAKPTFVTAGANQNVQRAGGALAAALVAAAML